MKAPALFIGHGAPTIALDKNQFVDDMKNVGAFLQRKPIKGIIALSAHWLTKGPTIQMAGPLKTIYDFYGFNELLYQFKYPAFSNQDLNDIVKNKLATFYKDKNKITETKDWGLDHGLWTVLCHLYPQLQIPITVISIDTQLNFEQMFDLGTHLASLRDEGYLLMASGNIIHSFTGLNFYHEAKPHPKALLFKKTIDEILKERKNLKQRLTQFETDVLLAAQFSINSSEHYLPFLFIAGALNAHDQLTIFNNEIVFSTLSMTSIMGSL